MFSSQTYLLKPAENKHHQPHLTGGSGPVFEFGPGWGTRLNKWLRKNGARKVLPPLAMLALIFGLVLNFSGRNKNNEQLEQQTAAISQIVIRGDSYTRVARRALAQYLNGHPLVELTPGQKVFIEEHLWRKVADQPLASSAEIKFEITDIESLVAQAKSLSPATLQKWEGYARGVRF